jgi:putative FmdB family regulatory protein
MPLYEYQCTRCAHRFEVIQKFSDKPVSHCPKCQGEVEKLLSAPGGLQFKGSGFYITDYARKTDAAAPTKEPAANKPAAAPTEANAAAPAPAPASEPTPAPAAPKKNRPAKS